MLGTTYLGGAGESNFHHALMLGDRGPGRRSVPVNDVDDPGWKAGLLAQGSHVQGAQGRLLRGFQDDRAAGRQCRSPLPGEHHYRVVPGDYLADDADRLLPRHRHVVVACAEDGRISLRDAIFDMRFSIYASSLWGSRDMGSLGHWDLLLLATRSLTLIESCSILGIGRSSSALTIIRI
jgi:hypothetical protein